MGRTCFSLLAALGLVACGDAFITAEETGPTSSATGTGGSSSSSGKGGAGGTNSTSNGGSSCGQDLYVPPLPEDWSDYAIVAASPPQGTSCAEGGRVESIINLAEPADNKCDCGCNVDEQACSAVVQSYNDVNCNVSSGTNDIVAGSCDGIDGVNLINAYAKLESTSANNAESVPAARRPCPSWTARLS